MNLVDAYVTKVISEPTWRFYYGKQSVTWWEVEVEYDSYGVIDTQKLSFSTKEEAEQVKEGYHFLT